MNEHAKLSYNQTVNKLYDNKLQVYLHFCYIGTQSTESTYEVLERNMFRKEMDITIASLSYMVKQQHIIFLFQARKVNRSLTSYEL